MVIVIGNDGDNVTSQMIMVMMILNSYWSNSRGRYKYLTQIIIKGKKKKKKRKRF